MPASSRSSASNGNSVRITNREIFDKVVAIEKKVDAMSDHGSRIRSLEVKVYVLLSGVLGAIGYVIYQAGAA